MSDYTADEIADEIRAADEEESDAAAEQLERRPAVKFKRYLRTFIEERHLTNYHTDIDTPYTVRQRIRFAGNVLGFVIETRYGLAAVLADTDDIEEVEA